MNFLEKDLEQIIYTSGRDVLEQRGLSIHGKLLRQVKIGNYGVADLIEFSRPYYDNMGEGKKDYFIPGYITIYELKKDQIGISAFLQAINYVKGILEYLRFKGKSENYIINVVLVGKSLDKSGSFCYIENLLSINNDYYNDYGCEPENGTITFYTYQFKIEGLYFKNETGYGLKDNNF